MQIPIPQIKSDFPPINSSIHPDQQIILTRLDPSTHDRFFLCAQDIIEGVVEDKSSLQTYEEFCNNLKQPRTKHQIDQEKEKEIKMLIGQKQKNLMKFSKQIEEEKSVVKRLLNDKLEQLYKSKCNDLVGRLQDKLDEQYKLFSENYENLVGEDQADHDKNARVDKYEEIKKKIKDMSNSKDIEDYLKQSFQKKIAWSNAGDSLQNAEEAAKQFYKSVIEKQLGNAPELAEAERIVDLWVGGLEKLIGQVKTDEGIFKNIVSKNELKLPLEISLNELELIQNTMIKNDTQLVIKLKDQITLPEIIKFKLQLACLTNLVHFVFDADQAKLPESSISEFIQPFNQLQKLETLQIKCFGSKITDKGLIKLSELFQVLPNLKELSLEIGYNQITTEGLNKMSENFQFLKNLQSLKLSFECNKITNHNLHIFCEQFEKILPQLTSLKLNFGGNYYCQNAIESIGCNALVKCLLKADKMKSLALQFGETNINNLFISELVHILPQLNSLVNLTLIFTNNKLDCKSARKLAKYFKNSRLCKLYLNLAGNQIKAEGTSLIIEAINQMELLFKLKLNFRNSEIKKGCATIIKKKLEDKQGRQFEEIEFLA